MGDQGSAKDSLQTEHDGVGEAKKINEDTPKQQKEHTRDKKKTSLVDQVVDSADKLGLKIPLHQRQLEDPLAALHLLRDHKVFTKNYYRAVFESLSDIESYELLKKWVHALCDGCCPQIAPFWWPSEFDYDDIDDQTPKARKEILQHLACGSHGDFQEHVLRRLRGCLGGQWHSVDSIISLRLIELSVPAAPPSK
ncbi:unnamed protein product [Penicillium pancosmium]